MAKLENLNGQKFGALTPFQKQGKTAYGKTIWLCKCDCGKITKAVVGHLKNGSRVSCGCRINRKHYLLDIKDLCVNDKYKQYHKNAKKRNYKFEITKEDFKNLIYRNCHYCNSEPSNYFYIKSKNRQTYENLVYYSGIDRIDNNKGYIINNCVPCCKICNIMKSSLSQKEFYEHIEKIHTLRKKKKKLDK